MGLRGMGKRKTIDGVEYLILREDKWGGYESIEVHKLTMKLSELFTDESLQAHADDHGLPLAAIKNMTLIAYIKLDAAKNNLLGWRQHLKVLRDDGQDV